MKLARAHGVPFGRYMREIPSREISWQLALEEVAGPQGEDRQDWRFAWLVWWIVKAFAGVKEETPANFLGDLLQTLKETTAEPHVLIDDDPKASARRAEQIEARLLQLYPKKEETKQSQS